MFLNKKNRFKIAMFLTVATKQTKNAMLYASGIQMDLDLKKRAKKLHKVASNFPSFPPSHFTF